MKTEHELLRRWVNRQNALRDVVNLIQSKDVTPKEKAAAYATLVVMAGCPVGGIVDETEAVLKCTKSGAGRV